MNRVLFVDDEQNILDGLRNLLRKQRKQWEMVFALGAEAALSEMAKAPFDVVVTDIRMPGMDGVTLLEKVRDLYPGTARLVLSGHGEKEQLLRAFTVAQQFLSKPCDAERLKNVLEQACGLRGLLADDRIRGTIGWFERLPSVPDVYQDLTRTLASGGGMEDVARVVERDPSMCAKVLQLVNSSFFGLQVRIRTIEHAVSFLGTELIRTLVLTAGIFSEDESLETDVFSLKRVQENSLLTARLCRSFLGDSKRAQEAYMLGLLHDIGRVVLALGLGPRYEDILREALSSRREVHVVEQEALGVTHAEVGGYLLGIWGLPLETLSVVCHHHEPGRILAGPLDLLAVVHVADALADRIHPVLAGADPGAPLLDQGFLERAGMASQLPRWWAIAEAAGGAQAA